MTSLWRNRRLIWSLTKRDIQARYRGSFGGGLWTILNPLLLTLTYFFVFGVVLKARFPGDPTREGFVLYFLAGMMPWLAISETLGRSPTVIIEHYNYIKKLIFPSEILPVIRTFAALFSAIIALAIFLALLLITRGSIPGSLVWLPTLLIPQILLTLGLSYLLATSGVFLRDLAQIIGFVLTLWFFTTPICYPDTSLPAELLPILGKNPLYVLVRGYRAVLLEGSAPEWSSLWKLWLVSIGVFFLGYRWFSKLQRSFADIL